MVRECRPPAREPASSWLARRSTMATSTPANANSPANINPVGPPPAITTACSFITALLGSWLGEAVSYGMTGVLKQAPCALHIKMGSLLFCFPRSIGRKPINFLRSCSLLLRNDGDQPSNRIQELS